jgi:hypothetical protein
MLGASAQQLLAEFCITTHNRMPSIHARLSACIKIFPCSARCPVQTLVRYPTAKPVLMCTFPCRNSHVLPDCKTPKHCPCAGRRVKPNSTTAAPKSQTSHRLFQPTPYPPQSSSCIQAVGSCKIHSKAVNSTSQLHCHNARGIGLHALCRLLSTNSCVITWPRTLLLCALARIQGSPPHHMLCCDDAK